MKIRTNIDDFFHGHKINKTYVKVCAPMVRYSKVHFRTLVKNFGVDLTFTPMVLADSFCQNSKARDSEFSTTINDGPLIVQFAANTVDNFVDASKLVYPYADGVDLNCGCPQTWAMRDGYGCSLLSKPEVIYELVKGVRNSLPTSFSISVKMRLLNELKSTVSLAQQLEKCGVNFLTVHGRFQSQKSSGVVDIHALEEVCDSVTIPVITNGGVRTLLDANELHKTTECAGVMAASGLLTNPALFSGENRTPLKCVKLWMHMKNKGRDKIPFQCYHHHLVFMLEKILTREQKVVFNHLKSFESVDDYLSQYVVNSKDCIRPYRYDLEDFVSCEFADEITLKHSTKCRACGKSTCYCTCVRYDSNVTDGSYFSSYVTDYDGEDYMDSNLFDEPR